LHESLISIKMSILEDDLNIKLKHRWSLDHTLGARLFGPENFRRWAKQRRYTRPFTMITMCSTAVALLVILFLDPANIEIALKVVGLSIPSSINIWLYPDVRILKRLIKEPIVWLNIILILALACSFVLLLNLKSVLPVVIALTVFVLAVLHIVFGDAFNSGEAVGFHVIGLFVNLIIYAGIFIFVSFSAISIRNEVIFSSQIGDEELTFDVYDVFSYSVTTLVLLEMNVIWKTIKNPKALSSVHATVYLEAPVIGESEEEGEDLKDFEKANEKIVELEEENDLLRERLKQMEEMIHHNPSNE